MTINKLMENQKEVIKILQNSYLKNKLVHAYIFDGDKGTGCLEAALYFASILLCNNNPKPCLKCQACTRVIEKEHTNVHIVEPINGTIKKEQITELIHEFSMSSMEEGPRIYIINQAEKLNSSSSNALLKFLEEPVPNRYAIIITNNYKCLLDTIISRCQRIHFKSLSRRSIEEDLINNGINKDVAFVLSNLTIDFDKAQQMIAEGTILDLIELAKKINEARNKKTSIYSTFYTKNKVLKENSQNNQKEIHEQFITIMMLICQERIKFLNNQDEYCFSSIVNKTSRRKNALKKSIIELEIYNKYLERIKYHVNSDLQYASMFLEIEQEVL